MLSLLLILCYVCVYLLYVGTQGLPVKILKALLPSSFLATCPAHLNLLDLITVNILSERYKLWSSSLWSLLHSPFSSLLGPNIRLRILFTNTFCLHSSLNVRGHVSQPYSTTGNINLQERDLWGGLGVDGRTILEWTLKRSVSIRVIVLIRLRIGIIGEPLWMQHWNSRFRVSYLVS